MAPDDDNRGSMPLSAPERGEEALAAFPKPTIAAIRGACVGGGVQLALACDLRITSAGARFGITPSKIGVVYPPRTTARLTAAVGPAAAKRLLFTGELICAQEAWRMGLVDEPARDDSLDEAVAELLATMISRSQLSLCGAKAIVNAAALHGTDGPDGAGAQAVPWQREMMCAADTREGITAFLERRAPEFTWR
ncbi:enoyl-CoA hydratase/isomerase family protein [Leekyejoonella antrihumi]|uniref:enoyl-CoA hydratase/isomerase family protein n=1 Tax=Leekyejoonella antrihumi TaxID=1660198 RepID=UPI001C96088D|nr:enoyl-CoA hydratase-related protein [Leekyejoonella antrihumi]